MTTKKHKKFVETPMGNKSVAEVPGIGPALTAKMKAEGIEKATDLFGQFLTMKNNKEKFQKWMKDSFGANTKQSGDCYKSLDGWWYNFFY